MTEKLRVGQAMSAARDAMRRHLWVLIAPLALVNCLSRVSASASWRLFPQHAVLADLPILLLVGILATTFAEVVVASMFLQVVKGKQPAFSQVSEVTRSHGFFKLAWRLYIRYLGWGFAVGLSFIFGAIFISVMIEIAHGDGQPVDLPKGWGTWLVQTVLVAVSILYSQYAFALPLFAQRKGGSTDLIAQSIARVRPVWRMVALVCAADVVFALLPHDLEQSIRHHFDTAYWGKALLALGATLSISVIRTWFVMVLTGLMLQTETTTAPDPELACSTELTA